MIRRYSKLALFFAAVLQFQCTQHKPGVVDIGPPVFPPRELQAAVLVVDGVYNSEMMAPMDVLQHTGFHTAKGIHVFTVAPDSLTITTFEGLKIIPDYSFTSDSLPPIDILVVPSARQSMNEDLKNVKLIAFVSKTGHAASYVISLCDGAFVLAKAGLLDLHECTTFPGDVVKFREAYPHLTVHENVSFVHDRKIITSAGGAKSYEPALYLIELLYGRSVAEGIAKGLVIEWKLSSVPAVVTKR